MDATATKLPEKSAGLRRTVLGAGLVSLALYLSGFFIWLTPLPIFYSFRKGKGAGLAAVALACGILAICYFGLAPWVGGRYGNAKVFEIFFFLPGVGPNTGNSAFLGIWGIGYYLFFAVMGVLLSVFETRNYSANRLIGQIVLIELALLVVAILVGTQGRLGELIAGIEAEAVTFFKGFLNAPQSNEEVQAQVRFFQDHAEEFVGYAMRLMPGMIVNSILFLTWLNVVAAKEVLFRTLPFPAMGPLRRWRLPFAAVWMVIGNAFLLIADRYLIHSEWLTWFALNAFMFFALIYTFQGLAIVVYYAVRWSLSPFLRFWLYGLLVLMILFQPFGLILVAFGFFDSWFDFRRLASKPKP